MFKKKKNVGNVQVYDLDTSPTSQSAEPEDEFADLGLSSSLTAVAEKDDLENMSAAEIESLALASARAGQEGTSRALRMANEARDIGTSTARTMAEQTEQLERMGENIEVVHDYLDKSDRIIDKMSKPKVVRMFQRKKPAGRGLEKVRIGKKDATEREELKARGINGVGLDDMTSPTGSSGTVEREELLEVKDVGRSGNKRGGVVGGGYGARGVKEDYSQYSEGVAAAMHAQDNDLDQISDALADMEALAKGMNAELQYQGKLIDDAQKFTELTSERTKQQGARVNNIK